MERRQHFLALDGMRGIAAIAVAVGHLRATLQSPLHLPNTGLAVDFFFMLSGFVISHAYRNRLARDGFAVYFVARLVRLCPLIVLGTVLGFSYFALSTGLSFELGRYALAGAFLVPTLVSNRYGQSILPLDPPAWSLFFEMLASALFGLGLWRRDKGSKAVVAGAALALAFTVMRHGTYDVGWSPDTLMSGAARVFFGFGAGVLLYEAHRSGKFSRVPGSFGSAALVLAATLIMPSMKAEVQLFTAFAGFPLLLLGAAQNDTNRTKLCAWLGNLSYPLYIVHWPIYLWVGLIVGTRWWAGPIAFVAAVLVAHVALKTYDEPMRKRLNESLRSYRAEIGKRKTA